MKRFFIDLRHHDAIVADRVFRFDGERKAMLVQYYPHGALEQEPTRLEGEYERRLEAARLEVGWGDDPFILASERFMANRQLEDIPAFHYAEYCDGSRGVSPGERSSHFWTDDPELSANAFRRLTHVCQNLSWPLLPTSTDLQKNWAFGSRPCGLRGT